jgi:hypothetical protein
MAGDEAGSSRHRRYLRLLGLIFGISAVGLGAVDIIFFLRTGETMAVRDAVALQNATRETILYGPALQNDNFQYKLALLEARHPDVVAIGSSRVLAFNERMFRGRFANLGGNMNGTHEGTQFIEAMLPRATPKAAIINLDFWWFNPDHPPPRDFPNHALDGTTLRIDDYVVAAKWLAGDRFAWRDIGRTLLDPLLSIDGFPAAIGIRAKFNGQGFRSDGSEVDFGLLWGRTRAWDRNFTQALARIRTGYAEYAWSTAFSEPAWVEFSGLVDLLVSHGVRVVIIIPPIARAVASELAAERYAHLAIMKTRAASLTVPVFDFSDLGAIGGTDCEFVDSVHVGETGAARMALAMSTALGWIDESSAAAIVAKGAGRAGTTDHEVDYLNLGCRKIRLPTG